MTEDKLLRDETLEECCRNSIMATKRAIEEGMEIPPTVIFIDAAGSATPVLAYNVDESGLAVFMYRGAKHYKAERICLVLEARQAELREGEGAEQVYKDINPTTHPDRFYEVVTCIVSDRFLGSLGGFVRINKVDGKKVFASAPEVRPAQSDFFDALWKDLRIPKEEMN